MDVNCRYSPAQTSLPHGRSAVYRGSVCMSRSKLRRSLQQPQSSVSRESQLENSIGGIFESAVLLRGLQRLMCRPSLLLLLAVNPRSSGAEADYQGKNRVSDLGDDICRWGSHGVGRLDRVQARRSARERFKSKQIMARDWCDHLVSSGARRAGEVRADDPKYLGTYVAR